MMNEEVYRIALIMIFMFYCLWKYPKMFQLQIIFVIMVPAYIVSQWELIDEGYALILICITFVINFFHLKGKFEEN